MCKLQIDKHFCFYSGYATTIIKIQLLKYQFDGMRQIVSPRNGHVKMDATLLPSKLSYIEIQHF